MSFGKFLLWSLLANLVIGVGFGLLALLTGWRVSYGTKTQSAEAVKGGYMYAND